MTRGARYTREGRERGMPAAREDSMTRLASLDLMDAAGDDGPQEKVACGHQEQ